MARNGFEGPCSAKRKPNGRLRTEKPPCQDSTSRGASASNRDRLDSDGRSPQGPIRDRFQPASKHLVRMGPKATRMGSEGAVVAVRLAHERLTHQGTLAPQKTQNPRLAGAFRCG